MDKNFPNLEANEIVQENPQSEKLKHSYLVLKKRISATHELIKQYNDKVKECELMKQELDASNRQLKKIQCEHNTSLAKVIKLEMQNTEYKKNIDSLTAQVEGYSIQTAADKQHIQQLICKIKDLEDKETEKQIEYDLEKSSLQVKVKELEHELKNVKKSYESKIKKMEKKHPITETMGNKVNLKDAGTNTELTKDLVIQKPVVKDAGVNVDFTKSLVTRKPLLKDAGVNVDFTKNLVTRTPLLKDAGVNVDVTKDLVTQKPVIERKLKDAGVNTEPTEDTVVPKPVIKLNLNDVGVNTEVTKDSVIQKPEVIEKCVVTDEFYSIKDDAYPLFCNKCEVLLKPPPLEKICRIMTESCPKLIDKISSPPKRPSSPSEVSTEINNSECKTENPSALAETPPPHLQSQTNHTGFIPTNLLPPHSVPLNRTDYCNTFSPAPSVMNQGTYYIGSTPINHLSMASTSTTNQNNQYENLASMASSSLSLFSSLQKRIDTLEMKLKKKLNKRNSEQNSSCCQHHQPNICNPYGMNNSMQFDFLELWRRMADFHKNKKKTDFERNKKSNKGKLRSRVKCKRLQSTSTGTWKIETIEKVERSPVRRKPKMRKYRYSALFSSSDSPLNSNSEDPHKNSDSDADFSADASNNTGDNKADTSLESTVDASTVISKPDNANIDEVNEVLEIERDTVECSRSIGGETDSGILSDSVECNKLIHSKVEVECPESVEQKDVIKAKSSMQAASCSSVKSVKPDCVDKFPIKSTPSLRKPAKSIQKYNTLEILPESDEDMEKTEDTNIFETSQSNNAKAQVNTNTPSTTSSVGKRKINEVQQSRKRSTQQKLLTKLKNLKKSSRVVNNKVASQNTSEPQDAIQNFEQEDCSKVVDLQKQTELDREVATEDDYVPKKKPRIAHVPKSAVTEITKLLSDPLKSTKLKLDENMGANHDAIDENTPAQKDSLDSSKPSENDNELQESCDTKLEEPELSTVNSNTSKNNVEDTIYEVLDISTPDITDLLNELQTKDVGMIKAVQLSEVKTESNSHPENFRCRQENNRSDLSEEGEATSSDEEELGRMNETYSFDVLEKEEIEVCKSEINSTTKEMPSNVSIGKTNVNVKEVHNNTSVREARCMEVCKSETESSIKEMPSNVSIKETNVNVEEVHNNTGVREAKCMEVCNGEIESSTKEILSNVSIRETNVITKEVSNDGSVRETGTNETRANAKEILSNASTRETNISIKKIFKNVITEEESSTGEKRMRVQSPLVTLLYYVNRNKHLSKSHNAKRPVSDNVVRVQQIADQFVKDQLKRLVDSEWQDSVHWDVIDQLKLICNARVIAKGVVEFLCTEEICDGPLDKTYTPPAPLMTKNQQKIVALLVDLEESIPNVFQFVQAGIEYKLFRLAQSLEREIVDPLARIYTILARIKKDREKIRIFCCDALYCMGMYAISVLYAVLTCWPEMFPHNDANDKLLPKCMAHLIMTQYASDFPRLKVLKNLISLFYKYPMGLLSTDLLEELLKALQEKPDTQVESAIILLAKREGITWTYKNVIKGALLPMIISGKLPDTYRAFCLLGSIMRAFPVEDKDNSVGEIVDQLCDLIDSGEGSYEQREGIISALLSLSRHKFDKVVQTTFKWIPLVPLQERTTQQIIGLFNTRNPDYWSGYLHKYRHLLNAQREMLKEQQNKT